MMDTDELDFILSFPNYKHKDSRVRNHYAVLQLQYEEPVFHSLQASDNHNKNVIPSRHRNEL